MKAIFLDRDGTLVVEPEDERVDSLDKAILYPFSLEALKILSSLDYLLFIITNQAGIAEGRIDEQEFGLINDHIISLAEQSGASITKTYMCPHIDSDKCDCRKPKPKLLLDAAKDYDLDMGNSWMIGDRLTDVEAGLNAGSQTILVKTGGIKESSDADFVAEDLLEAAKIIAEESKS